VKHHSSPFIAVFDFGTSSGRCLLVDQNGNVLASSQEEWKYEKRKFEGVTLWSFNPDQYWTILANCCQKALSIGGINANEAKGVITTSQRHGAVLIDSNGKVIDAIPNFDMRSTPEWNVKAYENAYQIYDTTYRWPQPIFFPAHLDWIRLHTPMKYDRIRNLLSILDWIVFCLCGEVVSEPTAAADLLLLDVEKREWSRKLIDLFNLNADWMPRIVPSGTVVGKVNHLAAVATGLPEGIPVLLGGADTQLGVLGLGCTKPNSIAIIMGSSIPLQMVSERPLRHPLWTTWTNPHIVSNQWVIESNAGDAGLHQNNMIEKITDLSAYKKELSIDRRKLLIELDFQIAEPRKTKNNHLLASLGPMIFNGRSWPEINGIISGFDIYNLPDLEYIDLYQALVENIAYAIKGNFLQLKEMARPLNEVRAGGGTMNSKMWQTFLPNVLGTSLQVPKEKEATSLGAALLAFVSLGFFGSFSEGTEAMIRWDTFEANQQEISVQERHYKEWLNLYQVSIGQNNGTH
jgi:autoinducer 2 (AI-2) kinase